MTPDDLRRIGQCLYGPEWQSPMARDLDVALRTVQRWASGAVAIRDEQGERIRGELLALIPSRMAEARGRMTALRAVERELRRAA